MTDAPTPPTPIQVNADPKVDQLAAGVRQLALALGVLAGAFGFAKYTHILDLIATQAAPIAMGIGGITTVVAAVVGQLKTRAISQKAATMASALPDSIAQLKK